MDESFLSFPIIFQRVFFSYPVPGLNGFPPSLSLSLSLRLLLEILVCTVHNICRYLFFVSSCLPVCILPGRITNESEIG